MKKEISDMRDYIDSRFSEIPKLINERVNSILVAMYNNVYESYDMLEKKILEDAQLYAQKLADDIINMRE